MAIDCVFCNIIKGKIPCAKIYEDDKVFAFLDIAPINFGHALVIPKKHYELLTEVPEDLLSALASVIKKIATVISKDSDGLNIVQNNGRSAGQLVPHVHFHIIPRFKDDGFRFNWRSKKYEKGKIEELAEKIKKLLSH